MKLDKDTVSTIESALIVAELMERREVISWLELSRAQKFPDRRRTMEYRADACSEQAGRYRKALVALRNARKEDGSEQTVCSRGDRPCAGGRVYRADGVPQQAGGTDAGAHPSSNPYADSGR